MVPPRNRPVVPLAYPTMARSPAARGATLGAERPGRGAPLTQRALRPGESAYVGLIPEDGSTGDARTRLVVPGVLRMRAVGPTRRFQRHLVGIRGWRLRGRRRRRTVRRRRRPGLRHSGSRFGPRRSRTSHVIPQGRPDDLPAPLGAGPVGELGPRQHLVYLRHVILRDRNPEHDGDAGCIRQPRTRHAFRLPRTRSLERMPAAAPLRETGANPSLPRQSGAGAKLSVYGAGPASSPRDFSSGVHEGLWRSW